MLNKNNDYEIISFNKGGVVLTITNGKYRNETNSIGLETCLSFNLPIHSVKRLSDNQVLSINQDTPYGVIKAFEIDDAAISGMWVVFNKDNMEGRISLCKVKLPTPSIKEAPKERISAACKWFNGKEVSIVFSSDIPYQQRAKVHAAISAALNEDKVVEDNPNKEYVPSDKGMILIKERRISELEESNKMLIKHIDVLSEKLDRYDRMYTGNNVVCAIQVGMKILHKEDGNWDRIGTIATVLDIDFEKNNVLTSDKQNYSMQGFLERIDSGRYEVIYYPIPLPRVPENKSSTEQPKEDKPEETFVVRLTIGDFMVLTELIKKEKLTPTTK